MMKYKGSIAAVLEVLEADTGEVKKVLNTAAAVAMTATVATEGEGDRGNVVGEGGNEVEERGRAEVEAEQRERNEMAAVAAAVMRAPWTWLQALGSREM